MRFVLRSAPKREVGSSNPDRQILQRGPRLSRTGDPCSIDARRQCEPNSVRSTTVSAVETSAVRRMTAPKSKVRLLRRGSALVGKSRMNAPIWTKAALAVALSLSAASPVGAQGAATPARGLRTPTPRPDLAAPAEKVRTPNLPSLADTRPRVPDVVGLRVDTALAILSTAGYQVDLRYLDVPDATIPHGFVKRMVPAAGTIQTGGRVAIEIPRPASKVGSAVLSIADFARNAGFDLDTGRYEAVDHGADLVLSKHDQTPIVDAAGKTTYDNFTIFADGGSGAVFRKID